MADLEKTRLDKWLWAARFFKTRSLAAAAVNGGHVHVDGVRAKPSYSVKVGDELEITKRDIAWTVVVQGINDKRRGAQEAQALYEETDASIAKRETVAAAKKSDPFMQVLARGNRPSKRDRRLLDKLRERRG